MGKKRERVYAGGALVWRVKKRSLQVLLIHRPRYDDWSWPKGKVDVGECLPACAAREVAEETGYHVELGLPLPVVQYPLNSTKTKVCVYWAARVIDGDRGSVRARGRIEPAEGEVDEARWVDAGKAWKMLTRKADREPLGALIDLHEDGFLDTWTVLIARHGRAKKRSAWQKGEDTRPLTRPGHAQARALVPLLAAYGAEEIITSPWARCHDTVVPYSQASGIELFMAPQITEHAAKEDPRSVRELVAELLGRRDAPVLICTHRPVMPAILDAVERKSPHRVLRVLPEADPYLRTGEVLVLHLARPGKRKVRVVSMEMHRPASANA
ncbi:NUDIX hydrolase [Pseudactinotalea sp. Z1739]|uniref:NUDIX hydrolase n=1 Tax=Pseudactinotalea sp. Z1739 TaxID=3413028 RepID=UPI003C7AF360